VPYGGSIREARPQVSLSLSRALAPGETVAVSLDGVVVQTLTSGSGATFRLGEMREGVHAIGAQFVDAAGFAAPLDLNGALPGTTFVFRARD
jgi:hypothetical protein